MVVNNRNSTKDFHNSIKVVNSRNSVDFHNSLITTLIMGNHNSAKTEEKAKTNCYIITTGDTINCIIRVISILFIASYYMEFIILYGHFKWSTIKRF